ncbi:MAG: molybdopterin-dependent oxidoreductase [Gammaproteobacteria bacterium]
MTLPGIATRQTTCPYCGVGCGISASLGSDTSVKGDSEHPANFGKLCSKGSTLAQTLRPDGRLLHPMIHGVRASWEHATHYIARQLQDIIEQHGPDAVAFYVSGQLLTEDYYVANKLMKGFIGSANIDTNSRLCMSSAVAGHKRAFGEDCVPACYEDLELADLIVLTGSNTAWCHPVLFQRIKAAKLRRPDMKVVVIDPRETATCEIADLHLPIKPGTDVLLFNGLLNALADSDAVDYGYIERHCNDFDNALASARTDAPSMAEVARLCDLELPAVETFYAWFTSTDRTVTCFSQGVNQSSSGTDKVNAIINCHLATGRIGKPGASPFSLTGQPNAMGGREVGGLANQLAAHMDFTPEAIDRVQRFWQAPKMASQPGLKAVDLFNAVEQGKIKAIWIMGTNPVVSMPNADQVKRALQGCPLVIVSDCIASTDTTALAHVLLPAAGWGEKDGTVTNSERRISRQRSLVECAGEARQDWRILADVATAMGYGNAFAYRNNADIFREHVALSSFENDATGFRQFNLAALQNITDTAYDSLQPVQWPLLQPEQGTQRLYADGCFSTADGKARFIAVSVRAPANAPDADWPLTLNTGRVRDQWHTMTRTALAPQLNQHKPEPYVELTPPTAQRFGLTEQQLARITTPWGTMLARTALSDGLRENDLFIPMHWNDQFARQARVGALVNPATDPWSGQPESKHTPCRIERWQPRWSGFIFSRHELPLPECDYACRIRGNAFFRYEIAGSGAMETLAHLATLLPSCTGDDVIQYQDPARGHLRWARIDHQQLDLCVLIGPGDASLIRNADRQWIATLFAKPALDPLDRKALLAGKSPAGIEDCGRTVCACFGVGEKTILKAARELGCKSATDIGRHLKAGTNCGSCVAEITALLAH